MDGQMDMIGMDRWTSYGWTDECPDEAFLRRSCYDSLRPLQSLQWPYRGNKEQAAVRKLIVHPTPGEELSIVHVCKTGDHIDYLKANHPNLYLSTDPTKVREALNEGIAAATMFAQENLAEVSEVQLRVAFDGDAVLFSDESEQIFTAQGLEKFHEHEKENENNPMNHGPLKGFLEALGKLQKKLHAKGQRMDCPIRTYLVTTRDAGSSGFRALKTLRLWDLEIDEGYFLAGSPKGPMLEKIQPHIFFDDMMSHLTGAMQLGIVACHVPYGISQRETPRGPQDEA
ncbi:hypothetical protein NHX12_000064 [Muraenolepis orangiensis]|uniref:Cytosolic 5'-nucleotidase 1A n=1 Tax=Muraenolepis orangiensis TaxID=630683 RepID=A0A9Q0I1D4_9TELE|nr:hypothetical protein NHX12_000064 [Muraenolepis orangiensis]